MRLVRVEVGDDAAAPDQRDEVVLADDAVAILHQMDQKVEHLRLQRDAIPAAEQFVPFGIERVIAEKELHVATPGRVQMRLKE